MKETKEKNMAFKGLGGPFSYGLAGKKGPFTQEGRDWIGELMMGQPGRIEAMPSYSPEQQQLLGGLVGGLGAPTQSALQNLQSMLSGDASAYEKPAMRQFHQQIVPGIMERFSGLGAGSQQSSAMGQMLGQAGAGLDERLAMQRAGLQERGASQLQSFLGTGMTKPFQYQQIPGIEGILQQLMAALGKAAGTGMGAAGAGAF